AAGCWLSWSFIARMTPVDIETTPGVGFRHEPAGRHCASKALLKQKPRDGQKANRSFGAATLLFFRFSFVLGFSFGLLLRAAFRALLTRFFRGCVAGISEQLDDRQVSAVAR